MEKVSADVFHHAGAWYLTIVDRATEYYFGQEVRSETTAELTKTLDAWFLAFSYPPSESNLKNGKP